MKTIVLLIAVATSLLGSEAGHLKLKDSLDRPEDGYCLDIIGNRDHVRIEMPLIAHNCKPGLFDDQAVVYTEDKQLYFPTFDRCVSIAGLNEAVLPGTPLMLRECYDMTPFANAEYMQEFEFTEDGKVKHPPTNMCLSVGEVSAPTFTDKHRWRTLSMQPCEGIDLRYATWELTP
jgi:hypothetical protein